MSKISETLDFCLRLAKAHTALMRRFDGRLGTLHGLSFGGFVVLLQLSRAQGNRLRRIDLADQLGLTASGVTRMLIPLEKAGLVKRQADPRDARVGYAVLAEAGQRLLEESLPTAEAIGRDAILSDTVPQLEALSQVLRELGG